MTSCSAVTLNRPIDPETEAVGQATTMDEAVRNNLPPSYVENINLSLLIRLSFMINKWILNLIKTIFCLENLIFIRKQSYKC